MRLFIAIELPEPWKASLAAAQIMLREDLGDGISWVARDNLHLTLKFFGEVSEQKMFEITEVLKFVAADSFSIELSNLGTLPPRGPARVIMAELGGNMEGLFTLQSSIEAACERVEIPREARKFRPHITLARVRQRRRIGSLAKVKWETVQNTVISQFVLMQSVQSASGSTYLGLAQFPLRAVYPI